MSCLAYHTLRPSSSYYRDKFISYILNVHVIADTPGHSRKPCAQNMYTNSTLYCLVGMPGTGDDQNT